MIGRFGTLLVSILLVACASTTLHSPAKDPLPSWNDTSAKQSIVSFVTDVTTGGSKDYVAPAARIATFDNDGTLWSEQPLYVQFAFALDQVKVLAPQHPEWRTTQPFKAVLDGDMKAFAATGQQGLIEVLLATSTGTSVATYRQTVAAWLASAKSPRFGRPYTDIVYQPMLELLTYLRANGFKTYIVSGGGTEFMRVFSEKVYGIPPEQVVGTTFVTTWQVDAGTPELMRQPKVEFVDDGPGKPVGIERAIGRRPIVSFGNSDGDQQMLEWAAAGDGPSLMGLVWHTDAVREWAYDRNSKIGKLNKALDEARQRKWLVIDMAKDWKQIYPFTETASELRPKAAAGG